MQERWNFIERYDGDTSKLYTYWDARQDHYDLKNASYPLQYWFRHEGNVEGRDAGGWFLVNHMSNSGTDARNIAPWVWRQYYGCWPEFILCLASKRQGDKLQRFQVVCCLLNKDDGTYSTTRDDRGRPVVPDRSLWENQYHNMSLHDLGNPILIRATQGHSRIRQLCPERLFPELTMQHLSYCHSLTHNCSFEKAKSIVKYGMVCDQRWIMLAPFPQDDPRHVSSSRDKASCTVKFKMESTMAVARLFPTVNTSINVVGHLPPGTIEFIYMKTAQMLINERAEADERRNWYRQEDDRRRYGKGGKGKASP